MKKSYLLLSLVMLNSDVNSKDNSSEDAASMANTEKKKDNMSGIVLTAAFIYVILKLEGNS